MCIITNWLVLLTPLSSPLRQDNEKIQAYTPARKYTTNQIKNCFYTWNLDVLHHPLLSPDMALNELYGFSLNNVVEVKTCPNHVCP